MSNKLEIEIKSLLGTKENADKLLQKISKNFPNFKQVKYEKQLNHYFNAGDFDELYKKISTFLDEKQKKQFEDILKFGKNHSTRTRFIQGEKGSILVIKAAIDDGNSHNGINRMEFEVIMDMSIEQLDNMLLDCGFTYLSKWSRERKEFKISNDINICIDKNAGYGYLAEFEMVLDANENIENAYNKLKKIMFDLGVEELPQDRLQRMFEFYNKNWQDYYGTDKVFTIF